MLSLGLPAQGDAAYIAEVANRVEVLGFERLWLNDTPMADGVADARVALDATSRSSVAVGVVAVDRRSAAEIVGVLGPLGAEDQDRIVIGLGAGFSPQPMIDVRRAVTELRELSPIKVAVAAMGPNMCALAGEIADVILLNWMTVERISWARALIDGGASRRQDEVVPRVAAYVRVAIGEGASELIAEEAARYAGLPHYARHFAAMGVPSPGVAISEHSGSEELTRYLQVCDEVVARALAPTRDGLVLVAEALV